MQFPLGPGVCAGLAEPGAQARETGKLMPAGLGKCGARSGTKGFFLRPRLSSAELRRLKPLLSVLALPAQKAE